MTWALYMVWVLSLCPCDKWARRSHSKGSEVWGEKGIVPIDSSCDVGNSKAVRRIRQSLIYLWNRVDLLSLTKIANKNKKKDSGSVLLFNITLSSWFHASDMSHTPYHTHRLKKSPFFFIAKTFPPPLQTQNHQSDTYKCKCIHRTFSFVTPRKVSILNDLFNPTFN